MLSSWTKRQVSAKNASLPRNLTRFNSAFHFITHGKHTLCIKPKKAHGLELKCFTIVNCECDNSGKKCNYYSGVRDLFLTKETILYGCACNRVTQIDMLFDMLNEK